MLYLSHRLMLNFSCHFGDGSVTSSDDITEIKKVCFKESDLFSVCVLLFTSEETQSLFRFLR